MENNRCLEAYKAGYALRYGGMDNLPEMKLHYFKDKAPLGRVSVVLGFLRGIIFGGECKNLLDVGSGRGVFLFPLLNEFPNLNVTSIDILPYRTELLNCLKDGGIKNLHPYNADICNWDYPRKTFDVVTALEVLEHIPDTDSAVKNIVGLAKKYVVVSVPSKSDNNPEHIHLFSNGDLEDVFKRHGAKKVKFISVTNHRVMVACL